MLGRFVNIFFVFSLIFIFILVAEADDHLRLAFAFVLSMLCSYIAFILNWLTLDGMKSAVLFGMISFGLGSLIGALVILVFFISSSLLSKDIVNSESFLEEKFRRNGTQVWSNGFWFTFWIIIWFLTKEDAFLIGGVASMASATADTWASEIGGNRFQGKTWSFPSFKSVKPGTDGGISIIGTMASIVGAISIGGVYWFVYPETGLLVFLIIIIAGVLGSFTDSLIGAKFQGLELRVFKTKVFKDKKFIIDNNMVNWLASGSASIIALVAILIS